MKRILSVLLVLLIFTSCTDMKSVFIKDKSELIERNKAHKIEVFTEELIKDLPEPLKKYLRICGYVNTPVPINANVYWAESWLKMSPEKEWRKLHTTQFNSVKPIGRSAYMKILGMPVAARDLYRDGYGEMNVKLLNLIKVAFDNSKEVAQSALITTFCEFMLIPGYLLLDNVKWEQIDDYSIRGTVVDNGIEVSGIFYFNEEGLFTHFETFDRYFTTGKNSYKKVKFSVVVESYKTQYKLKIGEKVKVMWHLPEGDYEYYKGTIDRIEFNVVEY
ncbi:MAG TPA: hypothetical protein PK345_01905 [Bacteroidales bacterium]|nr:hypothetical protein [Bacteroidales bacterium]MBP7873443.1 hypothetical protein [Bacteroidales bacterium]MCZ2281602.1 hypothetical protein [Bacteroidales bacterium]HNY58967.1 hypothetical protein [Bacteroidales bacterium]HOG66125.1 hypothetical protein [Bacteroidales bacterium]